MKTFKMILCCVIPTLLVLSIILNILLLCGFEFSRTKTEPEILTPQTLVLPEEKPEDRFTEMEKDTETNSGIPAVDYDKPVETTEPVETAVYEDDNIKITYLTCDETTEEIVHSFKIENKSQKAISLITSELYLNGQRIYISGLTCDKLLPQSETTEELVLLNNEWKQFTNYPSKISLKFKLINEKSKLDLYETGLIKLTF